MEQVKKLYHLRALVHKTLGAIVEPIQDFECLAMTDDEIECQTDRVFFYELGRRLADAHAGSTPLCERCGTCADCVKRARVRAGRCSFNETDVHSAATPGIGKLSGEGVRESVDTYSETRLALLIGTDWTPLLIKTLGPHLRPFIVTTAHKHVGSRNLVEKTRDAGQIIANRDEPIYGSG